jgi:hypothetical protein
LSAAEANIVAETVGHADERIGGVADKFLGHEGPFRVPYHKHTIAVDAIVSVQFVQ